MPDEQRGRPYVEAFPSLALATVRTMVADNRTVCEWRDEHGAHVGHARVLELMPDQVVFSYDFRGSPNVKNAAGTSEIAIRNLELSGNRIFPKFCCPEHGCRVNAVYFVRGRWACRTCHGLGYRVQRLSPAHKGYLSSDALSLARGSDQGHSLSSHQVLSPKNGSASTELLHRLLQLPEELRFLTLAHWWTSDDYARLSTSYFGLQSDAQADEKRGFRALAPRDTPSPAARDLARFPAGIKLIGDRLFTSDVHAVVADHFDRGAHDAASRSVGQEPGTADMALCVTEVVEIEHLQLQAADPPIEVHVSDRGRQRVSMTLSYTGEEMLWRARVPGVTGSPRLKAEIDHGRLVLAAWVDPGEVPLAEQVIRLALRTIRHQLAAHQKVLADYSASLGSNVEAYVSGWMKRYKAGDAGEPMPIRPAGKVLGQR